MSQNHLPGAAEELAAMPPAAELRLVALIDIVRDRLDDAIDAVGIDETIRQANALYDLYVAPIDVPYIPEIVEVTVVDRVAKQLLEGFIRRLHERIHVEG